MQVYLIRHTAPGVEAGVCYGQSDVGLARDFDASSRGVLNTLGPSTKLERVYSSPLQRCMRLARTLGHSPPEIDDRLLEMSFGEWEMVPWDRIDRGELDLWSADFVTRNPPGGENLETVYQRTLDFIEHLRSQRHDRVAVVTHAGVIRCFWAYVVGVPLHNVFRFDVEFGDVFLIDLARDPARASIRRL